MQAVEGTTRADIIECLQLLNEDAKALTRRGYTGTRSQRYAIIHGYIDDALEWLQAMA